MARELALGREERSAKPALALGQVAVHPLTCGGCSLQYVHHQFQSTSEGESGILVGIHSAELLWEAGWVAPPRLSDSVRMNRNNLLGHHS
jgi:hypothetical protein